MASVTRKPLIDVLQRLSMLSSRASHATKSGGGGRGGMRCVRRGIRWVLSAKRHASPESNVLRLV